MLFEPEIILFPSFGKADRRPALLVIKIPNHISSLNSLPEAASEYADQWIDFVSVFPECSKSSIRIAVGVEIGYGESDRYIGEGPCLHIGYYSRGARVSRSEYLYTLGIQVSGVNGMILIKSSEIAISTEGQISSARGISSRIKLPSEPQLPIDLYVLFARL